MANKKKNDENFGAPTSESGAFLALKHELSVLIDDIQETKELSDVKIVANMLFSVQLDMTLGETMPAAKEHLEKHMNSLGDSSLRGTISSILAKY
ncbi:MAG: hypothetical protein HUJ65_07730 [Oscillospiraceae bacterium]|nr:hypothetical protein [Oscillospiraceae bacterium]